MNAEKIILSIIGIAGGLLVAGVAFYFYQSTQHTTTKHTKIPVQTSIITPSIKTALTLTIDSPTDESVVTNKTITVSGKTIPGSSILISTPIDDEVASASAGGDFTTTATIDTDTNEIVVTSIAPNGSQVTKKLTVTYSTENF